MIRYTYNFKPIFSTTRIIIKCYRVFSYFSHYCFLRCTCNILSSVGGARKVPFISSYTTLISIIYIGGTRKGPFVLSSTTLASPLAIFQIFQAFQRYMFFLSLCCYTINPSCLLKKYTNYSDSTLNPPIIVSSARFKSIVESFTPFKFEDQCLICGDTCLTEFDPKNRKRWRRVVHCATADIGPNQDSFKKVMLDACDVRDDVLGHQCVSGWEVQSVTCTQLTGNITKIVCHYSAALETSNILVQ